MKPWVRRLARYKVYLDRGRAYLMFAQFGMVAVVFAQSLARHPWFSWIQGHAVLTTVVLVVGLFTVCGVLGWLDTRVGLRDEEWSQLLRSVVDDIKQTNGG